MAPNPYLLAADNSPELLPLLRSDPSIASAQDEHGYSLVHAAASYNHLDLLRALIQEFNVDVNIADEDNETALFVVETPEAAKMLVEELGASTSHRGDEGLTALEKIEAEADFPAVVEYLRSNDPNAPGDASVAPAALPGSIPPPPEGMSVSIGTMDQSQDVPPDVDPEFRRRIEELAQRPDFDSAQGQADLRRLVEDALTDQGLGDERNVKPKHS